MDSNDILDDKDSGPDIQINIPSSVMSRIEELMGGTEQFDNEEFDAVSYINKIFPTEQSLSGVENAAARCEFRLQGVEQDIRRLVRAQAEQREAGQKALVDAQKCIAELALQVAEINIKAERSESMVREITSEIKQLDCAKSNLTAAITALNHLHMLVGGVDALHAMTTNRQYKEIALPMQAIMEVLHHFEPYVEVREVSALRDRVHRIRTQLAQQILDDFKQPFTAGSKSTVSHRTLAEACLVVDVLEPKVKHDLLKWFINMQLQEYVHLFSAEQEASWIGAVERRYAWLKRHLLTFEQTTAAVFPPHWPLSEMIAHQFCEITRTELTNIMASRRNEIDVKLLLFAIQKTYNFELLLHKRFVGTDLGNDNTTVATGDKQTNFDDDSKEPAEDGPVSGAGSPWVGLIGSCFEPHLSLYVNSLDTNLRALMDTFIQDAKTSNHAGGGGGVVSSCAELFLLYKKCLVQCARLTRSTPMIELAGVFQKYLREYGESVLRASLPRPAPLSLGAVSVPALVTNLHTLLRDDQHSDARFTKEEILRITSVITTAEYCLETTVHLEQKLKEKVVPSLAERIDLSAEQEAFGALIAEGVRLLAADLDARCLPALGALRAGGGGGGRDQSPLVAGVAGQLRAAVPDMRDALASSRKYFTQVCIRFADSFIPKFTQHVFKCRPLAGGGAEQLLLDAHMLKTVLLEMPSVGSEVRRPAPALYARLVTRLMARAEMALKLVMAPLESPEQFAGQVAALLPDAAPADLTRILDMKGVKTTRAQLASLHALLKEHQAKGTDARTPSMTD